MHSYNHLIDVALSDEVIKKSVHKVSLKRKKFKPTIYDIRQLLSYNGWLKATDTYWMYLDYIKPYVDFKKLKKRISNYDKRNNKEVTV